MSHQMHKLKKFSFENGNSKTKGVASFSQLFTDLTRCIKFENFDIKAKISIFNSLILINLKL